MTFLLLLQLSTGFMAPPVATAPLGPPLSGGLGDLFDLGSGTGAIIGSFVAPKTVSNEVII